MQISDNCSICLTTLARKAVVQLEPCLHFVHGSCAAPILNRESPVCPLCREDIEDSEPYIRRQYRRSSLRDRELIVECSNRGEDWRTLAETLGIPYKTAYSWIRSGETSGGKRGGQKPRILSEEDIDQVLGWIENDCSISLVQLKAKIFQTFQKTISTTTIGNYLCNRMYTFKKIHWEPETMNNERNKRMRKEYVEALSTYIQNGRQVMWIDETNFNLFCRKNCGRSRQGNRAISRRPTARGK